MKKAKDKPQVVFYSSYGELSLQGPNNAVYNYTGVTEYDHRVIKKILRSRKPNTVWEFMKAFTFTKETANGQ